jgi:phenylacetate-coenzyme A ligase PaaK-like adenylate-forming protein
MRGGVDAASNTRRLPGADFPLIARASLVNCTGMGHDLGSRRSFASTLRYETHYAERCRTALDEALRSTRGYEAWRGLDPGPGCDVFSRLASLPALTKSALREHGPEGFVPRGRDVAAGLAAGEIELAETSGSTGDRVANIWYQRWWDASEAASWRLNAHVCAASVGEHPEAIITSPWCTGIPCEDDYLSMHQRTVGRFLYLSERSDPSAWSPGLMDRMAAELDAFKPVVIEANPSFLARLSRHIVERRLRVPSPEIIILTYENPSILHRRQIGRAFDAPIASSYGSTEAGYVFMECEAGRLHQVTESCHVDFLPFAPGHGGPGTGRILVTTFDNPWRSLVRFDIGDVVRLSGPAPCPCGRDEGLTLASIEGRTVSLTLTPEGGAVTQGAVDRALSDIEGMVEYQLIQTGPAACRLLYVVERVEPRAAEGAAREALRALYGGAATITAELVESIVPDPPGKYKLAKSIEPVDSDALLDARFAPPLI